MKDKVVLLSTLVWVLALAPMIPSVLSFDDYSSTRIFIVSSYDRNTISGESKRL